MNRLTCLDGLRGVLAAYVMVSHMAPFAALPPWLTRPLSHGGAAVDIFFILSGLVIVRSLKSHRYAAGPFLRARIVRIFPAYLAMLALAALVLPLPCGFDRMPWLGDEARAIWSCGWPGTWTADIAAHLVMAHGLFPNGALPDVWVSILGAAWSLSTEWQFYLAALLLGRRIRDPGQMAWLFLAVAAVGLVWDAGAPEGWRFSRAFLPNKAHYFAIGIASAGLVDGRRAGFTPIVLAALLLILASGGTGKLLPPLVWVLCLQAQRAPAHPALAWLARLLAARPLQWLGAISYSLYLANEPIQKLAGIGLAGWAVGDGAAFTAAWLPAALVLPVLTAAALHRWIEAPSLRRTKIQPST